MKLLKPFCLFLLIFISLASLPKVSHAQSGEDLYKKRDLPAENQTDKNQTLQDIFAPKPKEEKKKLTGSEMANQYYRECISQDQNYMPQETRDMFCGCTSARIAKFLSTKEIEILHDDTQDGDDARSKLMAMAYGPCMHFATKEVTIKRCMVFDPIKTYVSGKWKICNCVAEGVEKYVKNYAPNILIDVLKEYPEDLDPLSKYIDGQDYNALMGNHLKVCLYNLYEYNK